jgi:hypothetical protein
MKYIDGTTFRVRLKKMKPKQIKILRLANQDCRRKPLEDEEIIPTVLGCNMLGRLLHYFV